MYETIQGLPLFKGTTTAQISLFLEKTNVEFLKYRPSDVLVKSGEQCSHIRFLIAGKVKSKLKVAGGAATLCSIHGEGAVFCPSRLFGLYTEYDHEVTALTGVSLMQVRKDQYFQLIQTEPIFLLNYINYLSYKAQQPQRGLMEMSRVSLGGWLQALSSGLLDRHALAACMYTTRKDLCDILAKSPSELETELYSLQKKGEITFENDLELKLK